VIFPSRVRPMVLLASVALPSSIGVAHDYAKPIAADENAGAFENRTLDDPTWPSVVEAPVSGLLRPRR